jgi:hypothetical protein
VLVVHLKRFRFTRWSRHKLDTQVRRPRTCSDARQAQLAQHSARGRVIALPHCWQHTEAAAAGRHCALTLRPSGTHARFRAACIAPRTCTQVMFPLEGLDLSRYVPPSATAAAAAARGPPLYDCQS